MRNKEIFKFKQFTIAQDQCAMKVGTDGILLGAWTDVTQIKTALDIGSGTGLITIMLAQRASLSQIHGVEIDEKSSAQSIQNATNCPWSKRITIFNESIQNFALRTDDKYDLIVSNPPFFTGGTFSDSQDKNSVRHTIKLPHGDLLRTVQKLLAAKGRLAVILPHIEGLRFIELAKTYQLSCIRKTEVIAKEDKGVERLLLEFKKAAQDIEEEILITRKKENDEWTEEFIKLTKDFYL